MKIALFHNLPSGGAKRCVYEWVKHLRGTHQIDLFAYDTVSEEFLDIRPFVHNRFVYPSGMPCSTGFNVFKKIALFSKLKDVSKRMADDINRGGYDVAFVHHCQYVQSPMLLRYLTIPSLYYCQEPFRRVYEPSLASPKGFVSKAKTGMLYLSDHLFLKQIDRMNIGCATRVLANSCYSRETIFRIYNVPVWTCYLGVDCEVNRPLGLSKENSVVSVGMLHHAKGFDFLVDAIGAIPEEERPALKIHFNAQGSGDYRLFLEEKARRLGVRLDLHYRLPDEEVVRSINRSKVFVYAPILEPFGLVTLEAMACGVPVVGVREAGVRETVINGVNGLLVERDVREFADAVRSLLNSPEKLRDMGAAGRPYVLKDWRWEDSADRIVRNMETLVSSGKMRQ